MGRAVANVLAMASLLLVYGDAAASPFWIASLLNAVVLSPSTVVVVTSHLALALACALKLAWGDVMITLLMLMAASWVGHVMAGMSREESRVRAERDMLATRLQQETLARDRDRIARELHDGIGADVLALLLRLRRRATREGTAEAQSSVAEAQRILGEIRKISRTVKTPG